MVENQPWRLRPVVIGSTAWLLMLGVFHINVSWWNYFVLGPLMMTKNGFWILHVTGLLQ